MNFKLSNEIYEELTSNKYPTLFEIEIGEEEKIRVVRYEDYKRLENIIKEVRKYIEQLLEYKKGKKVSLEYIERIIDIINQDKRY